MSVKIPIYMYHHVVSQENLPQDAHLYVTEDVFAKQILSLRHWGCEFITLSEAWQRIEQGKSSSRAVVLTFDDVYYDFYESAFPILREFKIPATVFAISDNICETKIPERVAPGLYGVTENHLREIAGAGIEVGAHTVTHRELTSLSDEEVWVELSECKSTLENIIERDVDTFCYPRGRFSPRIMELVEECGYTCAVSTLRGNLHSDADRYSLKRIRAGQNRLGFKLKYTTYSVYNTVNTRRVNRETDRLFAADEGEAK